MQGTLAAFIPPAIMFSCYDYDDAPGPTRFWNLRNHHESRLKDNHLHRFRRLKYKLMLSTFGDWTAASSQPSAPSLFMSSALSQPVTLYSQAALAVARDRRCA